uniref:Cyclin-dependent kinase 1-like n=1 Tax=Nicotiana tabacum TaxID=4097 RepID=A0A1S3YER1_TOBAC|nr:PREDICTED: cyclin-dependent kinase 1-like [Nicotiana tabacum]
MANGQRSQGIMHGLLSGLNYLHVSKIIHRDFCPTNVLVKKNMDEFGSASIYTVKIADFSLSRYTGAEKEGYTHTVALQYYLCLSGFPFFSLLTPVILGLLSSYNILVIFAWLCLILIIVRELAAEWVLGVPNDQICPGLLALHQLFVYKLMNVSRK